MRFLLLGINIYLNGFKNRLSIKNGYAPTRKMGSVLLVSVCVYESTGNRPAPTNLDIIDA